MPDSVTLFIEGKETRQIKADFSASLDKMRRDILEHLNLEDADQYDLYIQPGSSKRGRSLKDYRVGAGDILYLAKKPEFKKSSVTF